MLAEIAAANAAFAVVKEALNNGGEIAAVAGKLGEYFGLKSTLQKKADPKGGDEFWALEALKQQEEELKQILIYQGRAGLWEDWLQFQAEQARARRAAEKEALQKAQQRKEVLYNILVALLIGAAGVTGIGIVGLMIWVASKS